MPETPTAPPPTTVPLADAAGRLAELADRAAAGETITLTRDGEPVATIAAAGPTLGPEKQPFQDYLLNIPRSEPGEEPLVFERDRTPDREVDLS